MRKTITTGIVLCMICTVVAHASPKGIWRTKANDEGRYLLIKIHSCGNELCGTIKSAHKKDHSEIPDYAHKGKPIFWDMQAKGSNKWRNGTIWASDDDKTYSSKLELKGKTLKVSGCIAFFCRSQVWKKVK